MADVDSTESSGVQAMQFAKPKPDSKVVVKATDAAMYRAKARGRNSFVFFRNALAAKRGSAALSARCPGAGQCAAL